MKHKILKYSLFEGKSEMDNNKEFIETLESTKEGKAFSEIFNFKQVKTGRSYISMKPVEKSKGISIPSKSYFEKNGRGVWYYEFASSNGYYGTTEGNLKDLFKDFIIDAIVKSRPSGMNRKDLESYLEKESNFPLENLPSPLEIYNSFMGESGFISDFSFLADLPELKRLNEYFNVQKIKDKGGTSINIRILGSYDLIEQILGKYYPKEFIPKIKEILTKALGDNINFESKEIKRISIIPQNKKGRSVVEGRGENTLKIGSESQEKIEEETLKFIKNRLEKGEIWIGFTWRRREDNISLNFILDYIIENIFLGKPGIKLEDVADKFNDIILKSIIPYFKENPLEIYLLEDFPELKKEVIEKTGIKDLSKIGKLLGRGFI